MSPTFFHSSPNWPHPVFFFIALHAAEPQSWPCGFPSLPSKRHHFQETRCLGVDLGLWMSSIRVCLPWVSWHLECENFHFCSQAGRHTDLPLGFWLWGDPCWQLQVITAFLILSGPSTFDSSHPPVNCHSPRFNSPFLSCHSFIYHHLLQINILVKYRSFAPMYFLFLNFSCVLNVL